jgi:transcription elongation factor GreA
MVSEHGTARVGSRVRIHDADGELEFVLVGPEDADAFEERISIDSPLGSALLGRHRGERVSFLAPGGILAVTIVYVG